MTDFTDFLLLTLVVSSMLGLGVWSYLSRKDKNKDLPNYKNISQMAQNLVTCKVGTRKQVLTDLYRNPDWTEAEVDELKGVLEGMLNTTLHIDKTGKENKGLIAKEG